MSATDPTQQLADLGITIGKQTEQLDFSGPQPQYVWTVPFTTRSGVTSAVQVAQADYTPDNVARMIHDKVTAIEAVEALGNTTPPPPPAVQG
jgi:hypothetical protein